MKGLTVADILCGDSAAAPSEVGSLHYDVGSDVARTVWSHGHLGWRKSVWVCLRLRSFGFGALLQVVALMTGVVWSSETCPP